MSGMKVEAVFAGVLALVVLSVAIFAVVKTQFGGETTPTGAVVNSVKPVAGARLSKGSKAGKPKSLECQCYDNAFVLAGKVEVISPEYRTGFEQCRAVGGVKAGDAWTAGWNARLSSKPFESSCKAYVRSAG